MDIKSQVPEFGVSDFVTVFNQTISGLYSRVIVTGEISGLRISRGKWLYYDLKDEDSKIRVFGSADRLPGPIENGMVVSVLVTPQLHPQFGFSLTQIDLQYKGQGTINKAFEILYKKLAKEGLFDPSNKRPLPFAPENIALITSKESAAYSDFIKIISARWPRLQVDLYDTAVQGQQAVDGIVNSLQKANQNHATHEIICIIRGGGADDDFHAFNDERVVRAISASRIPTVVAIGHERDESLAEFSADLRASTPSNAGELIVPDYHQEKVICEQKMYTVDSLIVGIINDNKQQILRTKERIQQVLRDVILRERQDLQLKQQLVSSLDPYAILGQGYALVKSAGKRIKSVKDLSKGDDIEVMLEDGTFSAEVNKI